MDHSRLRGYAPPFAASIARYTLLMPAWADEAPGYPEDMGVERYYARRDLEELCRDGSVMVRTPSVRAAQEWRAAMRLACRAAGLRVRTGLSGDGGAAWAYHVDHEVTEASRRASERAIEAAYAGEVTAPFHELVRQEQRKMLRAIPSLPDQV